MSELTFQSISGYANIKGEERHVFGGMIETIGLSILGMGGFKWLEPITKGIRLEGTDEQIAMRIRGASLFNHVTFNVGGREIDPLTLHLNTCIEIGNNALRLLARIHGSCEIHGWFAGEDRGWAAAVIEYGLKYGIMREGMGWSEVATFLRSSSSETVVMSFSISGSFPNTRCAERGGWQWYPVLRKIPVGEPEPRYGPPNDEDMAYAWDKLPENKRWELSLNGLDPLSRIGPDTIANGFESGATAFTVRAELAKRHESMAEVKKS